MRTAEAEILFVPGLDDQGPDHWITRWEERLKTARRVERGDAGRDEWTARIQAAVAAATLPVVIVAHSVGAAAVAHAASGFAEGVVRGAFLVSAPSEAALQTMAQRDLVVRVDPAFAPLPRAPLPFPSLLVASRDDPHSAYDDMADLALDWGSQIVDAGAAGHIDPSSGHGPWPEGLMRFGAFLARI